MHICPKKPVELSRFNRLINHGPVVLVSTSDDKGQPYVMSCAWTMPCRRVPPTIALAIGKGSHTGSIVRATGQMVVNIPGVDLLNSVAICGSRSGANEDKWKSANLTTAKARTVQAPWVHECIGHLECTLAGEWEEVYRLSGILIAEVRSVWVCDTSFDDGRWLVEVPEGQTLHHLGGHFFASTGTLRTTS